MKQVIGILSFLIIIAFTGISQQMTPNIQWSKCFGGSRDDKANELIKTPDGGFLILGSSLSNDGDITNHHGSTDSTDAWVAKISSSGIIQWQRSYGGNGNDQFAAAAITNDGNYVFVGTTTSNDGDVSGNHAAGVDNDIWLVKINKNNGAILWQKCLGGTNEDEPRNVRVNNDGTIFVIGLTFSADGDIIDKFGSTVQSDIWVVKLDAGGNTTWTKCYGGPSGTDIGFDILETPEGGFYLGVQAESFPVNLAPWNPETSPNGGIVKVDANKNAVWNLQLFAQQLPIQFTRVSATSVYVNTYEVGCDPTATNSAARILNFTDAPGSIHPPIPYGQPHDFQYCSGSFKKILGYYNMSPSGLAIVNNAANLFACMSDDTLTYPGRGYHGSNDGFITGFSNVNNGPVSWAKFIGGSGQDAFTSVASLTDNEFIIGGYTSSNDGDISGNHGGADFWVVKMGNANTIKGEVFVDYNSNGIRDSNEPLANDLVIESSKGSQKISNSLYQGLYSISTDTGTYSTKMFSTLPYYTVVPSSHNSSFAAYDQVDSFDFALQPVPGKRDYSVAIIGRPLARPGRDITLLVEYQNNGTDTFQNKQIKFIKDHRLSFLNASPAQTSINVDTIAWTIPSLIPQQSGILTINLNIPTPPIISLGDTILIQAMIDSAGDLQTADNFSVKRFTVVSAFDPNGKTENHLGVMSKDEQSAGAPLIYTIFFQNTGNDTAFNVILKDTLDSKLDSSTIEVISASHPYNFTIQNGIYCTWTFNNILLPDSLENEPASHGYVTYRIKPKSSVVIGDSIKNTASIYFDFNLPVPTNRQVTVLGSTATLSTPVFNGLAANYCSNQGIQKGKITNLPQSGSGISTTVKLDASTLTIAADSSFNVDLGSLSAGSHTLSVTFSNLSGNKSATFNFTVTALVTPDVNLSADITNVTNLGNPVTVTATNAAGGGTAPLYTFAKDKAFTNLLKAESSSDTLHITPSNLTVGDNWVYVRMKTNATCYTTQTNIDSIDIRRDQSTGIVDLDDPSRIINIYPNPFRSRFTIDGLNAGKNYTVVIYNLQGQIVLQQKITNKTAIEIPGLKPTAATYWLSIFDDRKQRLIGTVKLLKQ